MSLGEKMVSWYVDERCGSGRCAGVILEKKRVWS